MIALYAINSLPDDVKIKMLSDGLDSLGAIYIGIKENTRSYR